MAADKALIAGAAKVAGAQAKLDYATTKAFTDLGEDMESQIQLNLKNLQEKEEANTTFQTKQYNSVLNSVPPVPEDMVGTPFEINIRNTTDTYAKYGTGLVSEAEAGSQTFETRQLTDPKLQEYQKDMQNVTAISIRENDYITKSQVEYLKNSNGRHIDPSSPNSILATTVYKRDFKFDGKDTYTVNGKEYSSFEVRAAMDEVSSPDISEDVFNSVKNNTKDAFKGALNNLQAEQVVKDFKRTLNPFFEVDGEKSINEQNLKNAETFYIGQNPGVSVGALRNQYKDKKTGEFQEDKYADFLSTQIDSYLTSQKNQHYTPPEAPEVEEEDEPEGDTPYFIAQKSMLDKILKSNKLGENMYRLGKSPSISYYKSNEFKKMLPPQLTYVKEGDVVQIQDKKNTNINHIIDPELSLEYNINQLEALLRSKKS